MDGLTELEAAFFREGDEMSAAAELELTTRAAATDLEYYASISVSLEADACSGGFEAAA